MEMRSFLNYTARGGLARAVIPDLMKTLSSVGGSRAGKHSFLTMFFKLCFITMFFNYVVFGVAAPSTARM